MWILVSEIPLPLSEIPLPRSEIPLPRSGIPLHRSGFSLTRSGIPLPHNPIDTRVAYTIQYEFISGKLHCHFPEVEFHLAEVDFHFASENLAGSFAFPALATNIAAHVF